MAENPLQIIAQYESGGNPTAQNPNSTASGAYQMINSTWQTDCAAVSGGTCGYATAGSAPLSLQTQAAAYQFNQTGFGAWTCPGCDPALAAAVNAAGGPAAFQTNLATDAGTYAGLNNESLSQFFGTAGAGTPSAGTLAGGGTPNAAPGPLATPYTWMWQNLVVSTQGDVNAWIGQMQGMSSYILTSLLVVAVIVLGIRTLWGRFSAAEYGMFALRLALIVPALTVGNTYYQDYVVSPVLGFPAWMQTYVVTAAGGAGTGSTPAAMFDVAYNGAFATARAIWKAEPWSFHMIFDGFVLAIGLAIIALSLTAIFVAFVILQILTMIALVIGPVVMLALLFEYSRHIFHRWVWAVLTLLLAMLAVDVLVGFYEGVWTTLFQTLAPTGSPGADMPSFWGCAIVILLMGWSAKYVPMLISQIGSHVNVGLDAASWYMAGGPVWAVGKRVATGAAGAAGAIAGSI